MPHPTRSLGDFCWDIYEIFRLTSLDMRGTNVPLILKIALKNYVTSIPSD